ncbi:hypothetical protein O6H91_11G014300 [Diphasiastrum complanatum]|uniref:Uncharacterized protein n=2 Tax=Diphasiastrum complanatum TaxID=34168 RepID=A0ACC2C6L0_DIPCM|nr:hypothetical protein O6H91_11G014300 [Diphasiastrum complanatum]KAJ7537625.1 hypothetical protein O6H91_11G014300 [Diphasiastrum complanatum]
MATRVPQAPRRFMKQQIPDSILNDPALKAAISVLPSNYNLEIHKTVWRIKQAGAKRVALQFPEGLLMYSLTICDILETFADVEECFVLGDVTYGACCVDDYSAVSLGAEFLVHYGHSCLVPVDYSQIPCLYVFVDIQIDLQHFVETLKVNISQGQKLALAGTIQFCTAVHAAKAALKDFFSEVIVPQAKPLSAGEVLGCTAPAIPADVDTAVFVADGRFHLEAFIIANPNVKVFRYDPYSRVLTMEEYDHKGMRASRRRAIEQARQGRNWGIILGTLGRQGNPKVLSHIEKRLSARAVSYTVFLMSEISPTKIGLFEDAVDAWVQIACPRLSIDWGDAFARPLLTPYEAEVALGFVEPSWMRGERSGSDQNNERIVRTSDRSDIRSSYQQLGTESSSTGRSPNTVGDSVDKDSNIAGTYPMDYYARGGGPWNAVYSQKIGIQGQHSISASSTSS